MDKSPTDNRVNIVYLRSALNPWLVLSIGPDDKIVTAWLDPADRRQQWHREDHDNDFFLFNAATGDGLACQSGVAQGVRLVVAANSERWNAVSGMAYQAVRPTSNLNLNVTINAASQDVGAPVILWEWENGAHQRWALTHLNDMPKLPTTIVQMDGGRGAATVLADDGMQISVKDVTKGGVPSTQTSFRKIVYGDMFALQNIASGRYVAYQDVGAGVLRAETLTPRSLWTSVDSEDPGSKYVRPSTNAGARLKYLEESGRVGVFASGGPDAAARWSWVTVGSTEDTASDAFRPAEETAGSGTQAAAPYTRRNIVMLRSMADPYVVLSASSDGAAVKAAMMRPYDEHQQWFREDHDQNFRLFNVATGGGLSTKVIGRLGAVVHGAALFSSGDGELWNVEYSGQFQAIRPAENVDLNVTLNGNSTATETPAILWDWTRRSEQQWALTSIYDVHGPGEKIVRIIGGEGFLADVDGRFRTGDVSKEHWTNKEMDFLRLSFGDVLAFQHVASGKFLAYDGVGNLVARADSAMTKALWTTNTATSTGWVYLRPYLNADANLKAYGKDVGVWDWTGIEDRAMWMID